MGEEFWFRGAMADVTSVSEVCKRKRIIACGGADADFIWIRVSICYLQPLNIVDFPKKVNKILT